MIANTVLTHGFIGAFDDALALETNGYIEGFFVSQDFCPSPIVASFVGSDGTIVDDFEAGTIINEFEAGTIMDESEDSIITIDDLDTIVKKECK